MVACLAGHKETVVYLKEHGADLDMTSIDESTVLHYAASSDDSDVMKYILDVTDPHCINRINNVSERLESILFS